MEMCYDGALVMPSKFVVMDEEEMMYVDGGATAGQKALVALAIVAAGAGLAAALAYGQIWLAAKIMKISFGKAVHLLGIKGVATIVGGSVGVSVGVVVAALNLVF